MRQAKVSARKYPPSTIEMAVSSNQDAHTKILYKSPPPSLLPSPLPQAVRNLNPLICRFYFLDGKAKAMGVSASATSIDVIKILSQKIDLQSVDGWALYEVRETLRYSLL